MMGRGAVSNLVIFAKEFVHSRERFQQLRCTRVGSRGAAQNAAPSQPYRILSTDFLTPCLRRHCLPLLGHQEFYENAAVCRSWFRPEVLSFKRLGDKVCSLASVQNDFSMTSERHMNDTYFGHRGSVMAVTYIRGVEKLSTVLRQQHHAFVDKMCAPFLILRRNYQAMMSYFWRFASNPFFLYAMFWTAVLAATVTVAALSLEMGFSSSISPFVEIAQACSLQGKKASPSCRQCFWMPLDGPQDRLCVPVNLFKKSKIDVAVPPIFAGLVVAASALFVQGLVLWSY